MLVSDAPGGFFLAGYEAVLILVLVDVGLGPSTYQPNEVGVAEVLILVLVDVGLGQY